MGTKILRLQNQELIHFDQVMKGESVMLFNKEGIKVEKKRLVPQENSIYSSKMGTLVDDNVNLSEYSCSPTCMHLTGRIWEGKECPICHQIVKNNYVIKFDKNGWISLNNYKVLTPVAYAKVKQLIGDEVFNDIISFNDNLDLQGEIIIGNVVFDKKKPFSKIGMIEFHNRFEEIIAYYGRIKHKQKEADFLIKYKNRIWTSKINVLSQELRPAFINSSANTLGYDKINSIYSIIINNASLISKSQITNQYMNINKYLNVIQTELGELYNIVISKLDGKKKLIRHKIQGTKMSWSARLVITANTSDLFGLDHIVLSYKCFLELYKYEIINILKKGIIDNSFVNKTMYEILEWIDVESYSDRVNPILYSCMKWLINNNKDGLWCLVNRQPTMDLGSMQLHRVVDVTPNAKENTMRVPLTSLNAWNGDFDGDTLSIYSIKEKNIIDAFQEFNPRNLIVNKISGRKVYNNIFGLPKDLTMLLFDFIPPKSEKIQQST